MNQLTPIFYWICIFRTLQKTLTGLLLGNIADKDDLFKENILISFAEYVFILWVGWINFLMLLGKVSYWMFDNLVPFIKIFMGTCQFFNEYLLQLLQMISIKQFPDYCTLSQIMYPCNWFATVPSSIVFFSCREFLELESKAERMLAQKLSALIFSQFLRDKSRHVKLAGVITVYTCLNIFTFMLWLAWLTNMRYL